MAVLSLALGLFAAGAGAAQPDPTGLVAHWPLNGDGQDVGPNALHGTISGVVTPVADRFGNPRSAMDFSRGQTADYINIDAPVGSPLRVTGAITLAAWCYYTSPAVYPNNNQRILSRNGPTNQRGWDLNIESSGFPAWNKPGAFMFAVAPNSLINVLTTTGPREGSPPRQGIPFNKWFHLAGVFRPASAPGVNDGKVEIYLNGVLSNTRLTTWTTQWTGATNPVRIGNRGASGTNVAWPGVVDEAYVYARALSPDEIAALAAYSMVTTPSAPTLTRALPADSQVVLEWTAPTSGPVEGYRAYQKLASGGAYTQAATTTLLTVPIPGLTNGTTYTFMVRAYNSAGEGPPSNELSATPQSDLSAAARHWELYNR